MHIVFKAWLKIYYNLLPPLILAGQCLEQVSCFKYWRIFIDSNLSRHDHIDYVCDKVSMNISVMTKIGVF